MKLLDIRRNFNGGFTDVRLETRLSIVENDRVTATLQLRFEGLILDDLHSAPRNKDSSIYAFHYKAASHTDRVCLVSDIDHELVVIANLNVVLAELLAPRIQLDTEKINVTQIVGRAVRGQIVREQGDTYDFHVKLFKGKLVLE